MLQWVVVLLSLDRLVSSFFWLGTSFTWLVTSSLRLVTYSIWLITSLSWLFTFFPWWQVKLVSSFWLGKSLNKAQIFQTAIKPTKDQCRTINPTHKHDKETPTPKPLLPNQNHKNVTSLMTAHFPVH